MYLEPVLVFSISLKFKDTSGLYRLIIMEKNSVAKNNDEILVTEAEHASNLLPFIRFADYGVILNYIDLDKEGRLIPLFKN